MSKGQDEFKRKIKEIIEYNDENHELPLLNPKVITQGQKKLLRLIDDLIRNKIFLRSLKRVIRLQDKWNEMVTKGNYYTWTAEERAKHDHFNNEAGRIIEEYEKLKKRADKIVHSKEYLLKQKIAWRYGLDADLIQLTISRYKKDRQAVSTYLIEHGDMCRVHADLDDQLSAFNKGDDWIKLKPRKQLELISYPFSLGIHRNATKRDVLDFIEKNWWIISKGMRELDEKPYRARKRKHEQTMLDFIWNHRSLPAIKLKEKLDIDFPKNGLAYYELSKLIQLEKRKRLGYFEM